MLSKIDQLNSGDTQRIWRHATLAVEYVVFLLKWWYPYTSIMKWSRVRSLLYSLHKATVKTLMVILHDTWERFTCILTYVISTLFLLRLKTLLYELNILCIWWLGRKIKFYSGSHDIIVGFFSHSLLLVYLTPWKS